MHPNYGLFERLLTYDPTPTKLGYRYDENDEEEEEGDEEIEQIFFDRDRITTLLILLARTPDNCYSGSVDGPSAGYYDPEEMATTLAAMSLKERAAALAAMSVDERAAVLEAMSVEDQQAAMEAMTAHDYEVECQSDCDEDDAPPPEHMTDKPPEHMADESPHMADELLQLVENLKLFGEHFHTDRYALSPRYDDITKRIEQYYFLLNLYKPKLVVAMLLSAEDDLFPVSALSSDALLAKLQLALTQGPDDKNPVVEKEATQKVLEYTLDFINAQADPRSIRKRGTTPRPNRKRPLEREDGAGAGNGNVCLLIPRSSNAGPKEDGEN